jgi:transcription initiation factor TFIIIB Brf1 subunit/transcription initiation factor TFIIB
VATCPECGGEMKSVLKRKVCETCGLALWPEEYDALWDKVRDQRWDEEDQKKKKNREYLEWYTSHKK